MATIREINPQSQNILEAAFSSVEVQAAQNKPLVADNFFLMPLERIHTVMQPRREFPESEIAELAASIESLRESGGGVAGTGIIQPLILRPRPTHTGHFDIVAGERRFRAATSLHAQHVPALVIEISRTDARLAAVIENIQRVPLTKMDEATVYSEMMVEERISKSELARRIGRSAAYVSETVGLLKTAPDIRAMIEARPQQTARAARELSALPVDERAPIIERIKRGDSYTKVKPAIDAARDRKNAREQVARFEAESREPIRRDPTGAPASRVILAPRVPYHIAGANLSTAASELLDVCRGVVPTGNHKKQIMAEIKAAKASIKALENLLNA